MKEKVELYGNYWKMRKGNYGIPEEITIIKMIDENTVMYVYGHYTKAEVENAKFCWQMTCSKEKVMVSISEKQKKIIENQKVEQQKLAQKMDRELERFKNRPVATD